MAVFRYHVRTQAKRDDMCDGWFVFDLSTEGKPTTFKSSYDPNGGTVTQSLYPFEKGKIVYIFYKKSFPGVFAIKSGPIYEIRIEQL